MKGGYHIINFGKNELTDENVKIDGLHESIEGSYDKVIIASGIVINDTEYRDVIVYPVIDSDDYVITVEGYTITITDDDAVFVEAVEPEIPEHTIADAGKVLTVGADGSLDWQTTSANITAKKKTD